MRVLSLLPALALGASLLAFAPAASAAPAGSYLQSCRDVYTTGWVLHARCASGGAGMRTSSLNYRNCSGDIANRGGYLVCRSGNTGPLPPSRPDWNDDGDRYDNDRYDNDRSDNDRWDNDRSDADYGAGRWRDRADVTLFRGQGYSGRAFGVDRDTWALGGTGFNDEAQSIVIRRGVWQVCEHEGFRGRCVTLSRSVPNLWRYGLGDSVSSLRRIR